MPVRRARGEASAGLATRAVASLGAVAMLAGAVLLLRAPLPPLHPAAMPPDFAAIADPGLRKQEFAVWLAPLVQRENRHLEQVRARLLRWQAQLLDQRPLREIERAQLAELAAYYRVPADGDSLAALAELLRRVDGVPAHLALAQAAVESGWGTSRLCREANNYFGVCSWQTAADGTAGGRGGTVAMAAYADAAAAIRAYLYNLDVGAAYGELRALRDAARRAGRRAGALELAAGLQRYSERGEDYVAQVRQVLRANQSLFDAALEGY